MFRICVDKTEQVFYTDFTRKRKSLSASLVLAAPPQIDFFITYTQIHKDKRYEFETQNCA